jgi:GTP-binding protein
MPNAGKSSLIRKMSSAKPKVADYPFTTLDPKLGVVRKGDEEIVVADIPGLIEDAHVGSGLGFKFLKHIERCHSLIHVIDITNEDLVKSYNTIINELKSYDEDLVNKNKIIVLNKCDLLKKEEIDKIRIDFENFINLKIHLISTISGEGIDQLINEILKLKNI